MGLTECYSVYNVEKYAKDGLDDLVTYENEREGHPSKAGECYEYHEMHRTLSAKT